MSQSSQEEALSQKTEEINQLQMERQESELIVLNRKLDD